MFQNMALKGLKKKKAYNFISLIYGCAFYLTYIYIYIHKYTHICMYTYIDTVCVCVCVGIYR